MKYADRCSYVGSEKSARRLLKIADPFEPGQGGRIQIEKINEPLLKDGDSPAEFGVGLELTIARGWLERRRRSIRLKPWGREFDDPSLV